MPAREDVVALVERYVAALDAHDVDAALACFEPDARQDDPVGEGTNVGVDQIRSYLTQAFAVDGDVRLDGPVSVHGSFAAFRYVVQIPAGRTPFRVLVTVLVEVAGAEPRVAVLTSVPDSRVLN